MNKIDATEELKTIQAARSFEAAGWEARPAWPALLAAPDMPRDSEITEPSDLPQGWQRHAASALNLYYREHELMPALAPASRALLRSQSGAQAGMACHSAIRARRFRLNTCTSLCAGA